MKKILVLPAAVIITLLSNLNMAYAANNNVTSGDLKTFFFIITIGLFVSAAALAKSKQGKAVVFANYTDIAFTAGSVLVPFIVELIVLFAFDSNSVIPMGVIFFIMLAVITKATFSYNKHNSISAFLLAITAKIFLAVVSLLALLLAVFFGMQRKKRWYETDADDLLKTTGRVVAGAGAVSGIFLFLAKLGLNRPGFVSLAEYLNGQQVPEQTEQ